MCAHFWPLNGEVAVRDLSYGTVSGFRFPVFSENVKRPPDFTWPLTVGSQFFLHFRRQSFKNGAFRLLSETSGLGKRPSQQPPAEAPTRDVFLSVSAPVDSRVTSDTSSWRKGLCLSHFSERGLCTLRLQQEEGRCECNERAKTPPSCRKMRQPVLAVVFAICVCTIGGVQCFQAAPLHSIHGSRSASRQSPQGRAGAGVVWHQGPTAGGKHHRERSRAQTGISGLRAAERKGGWLSGRGDEVG